MKTSTYVDFLMQEWRMGEQSRRMQTCVRWVLNELDTEALLILKDPRLEVMVLPDKPYNVWSFFPVRNRDPKQHVFGFIMPKVRLKSQTRILLVLSAVHFEKEPATQLGADLGHHLGHTLLYLRDPKARNECKDARKEWRDNALIRLSPK